jgi:hypothetical protein
MNDPLQEFEAELKQLRPRAPSPALLARLERELDSIPAGAVAARPRRSRIYWLVLPAAAAAGLAVASLWGWRARLAPPAEFKPVAATQLLYASREEGAVTLPGGVQARRVRSQYVDTYTWRNPRTRASLQWTVPREEVRVVPIQFY